MTDETEPDATVSEPLSTERETEIDLKNPFADLSKLAVVTGDTFGVRKALLDVPCRKPGRQTWFRVDSRPDFRLETAILELKDDREIFLVMPGMRDALLGETRSVRLFTAYTRTGDPFLIPVTLPDESGRENRWHTSLLRACELAMQSWTRIQANMPMGRYDVVTAAGSIPEPEWRTEPFAELMRIAFQDRLIDTEGHPVVRSLLGYT